MPKNKTAPYRQQRRSYFRKELIRDKKEAYREKSAEWDRAGYDLFDTLWNMPCTIDSVQFNNASHYVSFCMEHIGIQAALDYIDSIPDANKVPKKADLAPGIPPND